MRYSCVLYVADYVVVTVVPFIALMVLCVTVVIVISVSVKVVKNRKKATVRYETLATEEALESSLPAMTVQPSIPNPSVNPSEHVFDTTASPPPYTP